MLQSSGTMSIHYAYSGKNKESDTQKLLCWVPTLTKTTIKFKESDLVG